MALLLILSLIGTCYCIYSNAESPVREFEITAVGITLLLVAGAVFTDTSQHIAIPLAIALASPLWYLSYRIRRRCERAEGHETSDLWRRWTKNVYGVGPQLASAAPAAGEPPLAERLQQLPAENIEEILLTAIPLPPADNDTEEALLREELAAHHRRTRSSRSDKLTLVVTPTPVAAPRSASRAAVDAELELAPLEDNLYNKRRI